MAEPVCSGSVTVGRDPKYLKTYSWAKSLSASVESN